MISFVATAEKFTSPYEFGVYDLLVLPESFPYGGELARHDHEHWADA
jgi:hypothetical protein